MAANRNQVSSDTNRQNESVNRNLNASNRENGPTDLGTTEQVQRGIPSLLVMQIVLTCRFVYPILYSRQSIRMRIMNRD